MPKMPQEADPLPTDARTGSAHPALSGLVGAMREERLHRRTFLRLACLLGLAAPAAYALAGIPQPAFSQGRLPFAPDDPKARRGGLLRIAMQVQKMHDPATYAWVEMSNQTRHIVEYLTITGPDNVTRPMLTERWQASEDLKTWTFHLRRNVSWHNGDPFTAHHVAWNIARWLDPGLGSSNIALSTFAAMLRESDTRDARGKPRKEAIPGAVEVVDAHTIRLHLAKPVLSVPEDFYSYPAAILHPSFTPPFWKNPIGTGPYTLKDLRVAQRCILARVTQTTDGKPFRYWGGDVYLDEIRYYHYDLANQLAALATGEVDAIYSFGVEQLEFARSFPGQILTAQTARTLCCRMRVDTKPFDNAKLRRALQLATDAREIHRLVFGAYGAIGEHHHVAPLHPEYFKLPPPRRNIEGARALLAEAGYADGIDLTIAVGNTDGPWQQTVCEALRDQWQAIGVRLAINVMPASKYLEVWKDVPFGATAWTHRPLGTMVLSLAYRDGSPWNETRYNDPQFEAELAEAEALIDPAKRRLKMETVEKRLQDSAIVIQPVWQPEFTMVAPNMRGYSAHPTQYHQLNKVWLA